MKPPFAYYGGKQTLADRIVALFPPHRVYLEPFAGSLAVLFAKSPAPTESVNDVDDGIVTFFRVLRDQPEELERVCRLTPHARSEYNAAARNPDDGPVGDVERARRFFVAVSQSHSASPRTTSGWSISSANTQSRADKVNAYVTDRFRPCAERLARVGIENTDAAELITRLANSPDTVVYADPPYLASTRNSTKDYRRDMGSAEEHERLAHALHDTPATVFLSGYRSPLYDRLHGDWHRMDVTVPVTSSNTRTALRRTAVESVWSNQPIATQGRLNLDATEAPA